MYELLLEIEFNISFIIFPLFCLVPFHLRWLQTSYVGCASCCICVDGLSFLVLICESSCELSLQEKEGDISDYMRHGLSGSSSLLP